MSHGHDYRGHEFPLESDFDSCFIFISYYEQIVFELSRIKNCLFVDVVSLALDTYRGHTVPCRLDSGSPVSFVSKNYARRVSLTWRPVHKSFISIDNTPFEATAMTDIDICLLYTSPSPRDLSTSRMPSSA